MRSRSTVLRYRQPAGWPRRIALLVLAGSAVVTMAPGTGLASSCERGIQLYDRLSPSIVRVEARPGGSIFARPHLGSGVVIGDQLVVTADHVVAGASELWMITSAERKQRAQVVRRHPEADLTLVKLAETNTLTPLTLSGRPARAGQCVAVLGNVMHGGIGIFCGMVSMVGPPLSDGAGHILTDIVAPPGLSGGALVDCETGSLVGIVSFGLVDLSSPSETAGIIGAAPVSSLSDMLRRRVAARIPAEMRRSLRKGDVDLDP